MIDIAIEPLGQVQIGEQDVYEFPAGLPGFSDVTRFAFVQAAEYQPFVWMVAVDNPDLVLVTIDPLLVCPDYRPRLAGEDLEVLGLAGTGDAKLMVIVTIGPDPTASTANLRGPVVLNERARRGRQAILAGQEYSTRQALFGGGVQATDGSRRDQGRRDRRAGANT